MTIRIQKKSWEHTRFYALLTLLIGLIFARYGLQLAIPRIILTAIIALIALEGNRNEILVIAMCCIPLHEAIDFFYAVVACAGAYVVKNHRHVRINLSVVLVLVMISWELLHCFDGDFTIMTFLTSVVPLIFLAVVLCIDVTDLDYDQLVRILAVMTIVLSMALLMNLVLQAGFNVAGAIAGLRRLGMIAEEYQEDAVLGLAINPNTLGIICVLASTGLLQLWSVGRSRKADLFMVIILLVFGTLTSSRTFLVCLILMALLLVLGQPGDMKKKIQFLVVLTLFAGFAVFLLSWLFPDLLEYYVRRFQVADITNGRSSLMRLYHDFISDNLNVMFFGVGLHNFGIKLTGLYRVAQNVPHNSIQEIIIAWGVPGLMMLFLLGCMLLVQSRRFNRRQMLLNYIPLLVILAKSMVGQLLTSPYTMLTLAYAYLSLCQNFRRIKK